MKTQMTNKMTHDVWFATLCLRITFPSGFTFHVAVFPLDHGKGQGHCIIEYSPQAAKTPLASHKNEGSTLYQLIYQQVCTSNLKGDSRDSQ